jgi:Tfp pilus assembly major pilin PilA
MPNATPSTSSDFIEIENNSGGGSSITLPDGVAGWSWGAFLFNWIWAIFNKTWIGLACLIPYIGFIVGIYLGIKGRELAWRNKEWDSLEHFNRVQRKWSVWGVVVIIGFAGTGILAAIALPAYQDYTMRAQTAQGVLLAQHASAAVTGYFERTGELPASLEQAGFKETLPAYVKNINIDSKSGIISVTMAKGMLNDKSLAYIPSLNNSKQLEWTCGSEEIRVNWLPRQCRPAQ